MCSPVSPSSQQVDLQATAQIQQSICALSSRVCIENIYGHLVWWCLGGMDNFWQISKYILNISCRVPLNRFANDLVDEDDIWLKRLFVLKFRINNYLFYGFFVKIIGIFINAKETLIHVKFVFFCFAINTLY